MKSPATTKEIQSLTGKAAALNRFFSRSTDKCRPFFKALKKGHKGKWDDECEVDFQNLKTYLISPPLLSKPIPGEDLHIYLAYLGKVQGPLKEFPTFNIQQVPRAENIHAYALASLGSALDTQFRRSISVEHLDRASIEEIESIDSMHIDEYPSWQDPIIDYLVNGNLPTDKSEATYDKIL
ncbi:hypothetical protein L3X38_045482 [Prunus dulcis]|uniref:Reverse transcriptase/retrotransposon-derived protein RNase H-like domain-containing protein n=1 Tax=Prunus dulcis TaxID=3755 RepID=A0AAD4YJD2_PRUDU|nr:hypothetical protein L3X38_045482 [Prunus dulcis]